MPIDKFGRHMLKRKLNVDLSPHLLTSPTPMADLSPFYICQPASHHAKCVLQIHGIFNMKTSVAFYTLDQQDVQYKFPVSGKLESIDISPATTLITLNDAESVSAHDLVETIVNKGDTLKFLTSQPKSTPSLYVQIVVQCPIAKDE